MGTEGNYLYRPDYGEYGTDNYTLMDNGLSAADAELTAGNIHRTSSAADDHPQYMNISGIRAFTDVATGTVFWGSTAVSSVTISATNLTAVNISATTYENALTSLPEPLTATDFSAASLTATTLCATNLTAVNISATTYQNIQLEPLTATNISGSLISGTNVYVTTVSATNVTATTFSGTNVYVTTLTATSITAGGANITGIVYGTGTPPDASDYADGTLWVKYTA